MQVPSFFVHEDHLAERLAEHFDCLDHTCVQDMIEELRILMQSKSIEHSPFTRFLVSTSCHTGIDALGDSKISHACFIAACHYYFGF